MDLELRISRAKMGEDVDGLSSYLHSIFFIIFSFKILGLCCIYIFFNLATLTYFTLTIRLEVRITVVSSNKEVCSVMRR